MRTCRAVAAILGFAVLGAAALWSVVSTARAQDLPPGPDVTLVQQTCTGCHDSDEFTVMRLNADDWSGVVDEMIGMGAQISDIDRSKIVGYLAANFPAATSAAPSASTLPPATGPATPPASATVVAPTPTPPPASPAGAQ